MVIMNLELENILGFPNFKMNFSYPKKIVSSISDTLPPPKEAGASCSTALLG